MRVLFYADKGSVSDGPSIHSQNLKVSDEVFYFMDCYAAYISSLPDVLWQPVGSTRRTGSIGSTETSVNNYLRNIYVVQQDTQCGLIE